MLENITDPDSRASKASLLARLAARDINVQQGSNRCFVSCWHSKEHESAALWKLYSRDEDGVAIRTTVKAMKAALKKADDMREGILGSVSYRDYSTEYFTSSNMLEAVFSKRKSFEHEAEVRLVYWDVQTLGWDNEPYHAVPGVSIPISLRKLILEVVVSPYAPTWCVETISEVAKKMGLKAPVRKSRLLDAPLQAQRFG